MKHSVRERECKLEGLRHARHDVWLAFDIIMVIKCKVKEAIKVDAMKAVDTRLRQFKLH